MEYYTVSDEKKTPARVNWLKWIPLISLIVGLCAITFQITVLYPWHEEISSELHKLAKGLNISLK